MPARLEVPQTLPSKSRPRRLPSCKHSAQSSVLYFHKLTKPSPYNPFVLILMQMPGGWHPGSLCRTPRRRYTLVPWTPLLFSTTCTLLFTPGAFREGCALFCKERQVMFFVCNVLRTLCKKTGVVLVFLTKSFVLHYLRLASSMLLISCGHFTQTKSHEKRCITRIFSSLRTLAKRMGVYGYF